MSQSGTSNQPESTAKVESQKGQFSQDEDGFVDIQHADVDMQDTESDDAPHSTSAPLQLQRYSNNLQDPEDDSDDDHDAMANHPLLSMLTGRLGARRRGSSHEWDRLHPENQALSVANADECSSLEESVFPPEERASREKVRMQIHHPRMAITLVHSTAHSLESSSRSMQTDNVSPVSLPAHQMPGVELGIIHSAHKSRGGKLVQPSQTEVDGPYRLYTKSCTQCD